MIQNVNLGQVTTMHVQGGFFRLDGGAMFGIVPKILWENKPYFVLFGERDASAGGAFCSVMTNLDYEEAKNEISQNFTTANLIKEDIMGPNNIAIYKSNFPGLPPVILSVQSAHGMSSFSIYKQ